MNPAECFQDEINDIFDDFLGLMRNSRAKVIIESQRYYGFCIVTLTLFKCRSCSEPLITTTIHVRSSNDVIHLARFLDCIVLCWKKDIGSDTDSDI